MIIIHHHTHATTNKTNMMASTVSASASQINRPFMRRLIPVNDVGVSDSQLKHLKATAVNALRNSPTKSALKKTVKKPEEITTTQQDKERKEQLSPFTATCQPALTGVHDKSQGKRKPNGLQDLQIEFLNSPALDPVTAGSLQSSNSSLSPMTNSPLIVLNTPISNKKKVTFLSTKKMKFQVWYHCQYGQNVHIVGNCPELGDWDITKSVKLEWFPGDVWKASIEFVEDQSKIEYKYILKNDFDENFVIWQPGPNRKLNKTLGEHEILIQDEW